MKAYITNVQAPGQQCGFGTGMSIEKLKAAYEATTPGEWLHGECDAPNMATVGTGQGGWLGLAQMFGDTDAEADANAAFIALAHNLMPLLLDLARAAQIVIDNRKLAEGGTA